MPGKSLETRSMKNFISGIYLIVNRANGKVYIGQSCSCTTRWRNHEYLLKKKKHGNVHLQAAFNLYGIDQFEYMLLEECAIEFRDASECYWMNLYQSNEWEYGYNLQYGGHNNKNHSAETREKQRQKKLGTHATDETRKKMSDTQKKKTNTAETRAKIGEANKGKAVSQETCLKLSEALRGNKNALGNCFTDETRKKMSDAQKGKVLSAEHRRKIGEAETGEKHHFYGKKFSDEYRKKMSDAHLGKIPWNKGKTFPKESSEK